MGGYHIRRTPYPSSAVSLLTIGRFSAWAWAISMRSKGSWCGPGKRPARTACSTDTANSTNRARLRCPVKSRASSAPLSSRPERTFVAISQADAELTKTSLPSRPITFRAVAGSKSWSFNHHRSACVSSRRRKGLIPKISVLQEVVVRKIRGRP